MRIRDLTLCILFFVFLVVDIQAQKIDSLLNLYHNHPEHVLITAHRGGHIYAPENSLAAIEEAVAAGASFVEIDVRETKDGIMVLSHDKTIDRTTTGTGEISELTYSELMNFNLVHKGAITKYKIPTFKEALALCKGKILVDIDFKLTGDKAYKKAFEIIKEVGVEAEVLFYLYDFTQMEHLIKINPDIKVMPRAYNNDELSKIIDLGLSDVIHVDPSFEDSPLLKVAHERGYRIWINTLGNIDRQSADNEKVYIDFLRRFPYANIIQTDYPERIGKAINTINY